MTEIERPVLTAMFNPVVYPENLRDAAAVELPRRTFSIRSSRSTARCRGARDLIDGDFTVSPTSTSPPSCPEPGRHGWISARSRKLRSDSRGALRPAARAARELQR
jgi:hypothetical protein